MQKTILDFKESGRELEVLDPKSIKRLKPQFSPIHSLFDLDLTHKGKHVQSSYTFKVDMQHGEPLFTQVFNSFAQQNKLSVSKKKPLQVNNMPEFLLIQLTNKHFDPALYDQVPHDIDDIFAGQDGLHNATGLSKPYIL